MTRFRHPFYEEPMPNPSEAFRHEDRADPYPDPLPPEKQPQAASQTPPAMRDLDHLRALVETFWFLPVLLVILLSVLTLGLVLGIEIATAKHRQQTLHPSTNQTP